MTWDARGKELRFTSYALVKAANRNVQPHEVARAIEEGQRDDKKRLCRLWIAKRTVIVYYEERESYHYVRNIGVTRRRL